MPYCEVILVNLCIGLLNFYFHYVDHILRAAGVEIGKRDFPSSGAPSCLSLQRTTSMSIQVDVHQAVVHRQGGEPRWCR